MRNPLTIILSILLTPILANAQTLADRIPDDAQIYFASAGIDNPGPLYDQSHLKPVLEASQLTQFFNDSIPRLITRIQQQDPQSAQKAQLVLTLLKPLAHYPSALYFGGIDSFQPGGPPIPKIAIICSAGNDAPAIAQQVDGLLAQAGESPFTCKTIDSLVVLADFTFPDHPKAALADNAAFKAAMAQVSASPFSVLYVDGTALMSTINAAVAQWAGSDAQQQWPPIRDALGLGGLKTIVATSGFEGKNWSTTAWIAAPAPRTGLLALADAGPIPDDLIKRIPSTSTRAAAGTLDLSALYTTIDQAITQFSPDNASHFHQAVDRINQMLGLNIQTDLLASFGPQWAAYGDPNTVGVGPLGMTLVNQPRNADTLQTSLTKIEDFADRMIAAQLNRGPNRMTIKFAQYTDANVTVHYLAVPFVSPAWAIKDGVMYAGLFTQVVSSALNRAPNSKSILDNPDFITTRQKLGAPQDVTSFAYMDLTRNIPIGYQNWLMASRMYLGFGDVFDMNTPPLLLPTLDKIMPEVEPSGMVSWKDDTGFHYKAIEPFPGANVLGSGDNIIGASAMQGPIMMSILLPSLSRARETAKRVQCASNLRQIGQAILLYSNDHKGAYPPDLGTLIKTEDITAQVFVCPDTGKSPPPNMQPDEAAAWVNQNSDYVYVGANMTQQTANPQAVVCYEHDADHGRDGMNMLFGDGHVEFQTLNGAHQLIQGGGNAPAQPPQGQGGGL
jgi:prepilin-type processing-associated H-X9-DG protein